MSPTRPPLSPGAVAGRMTGILCQEGDAAAAAVSEQRQRSKPGRAAGDHG